MNLLDFDSQETWNQLYRCEIDGEILGYERKAKPGIIGLDAEKLGNALNLQPGQRILLVGGGYGFVQEDLEQVGLGPIVTTDISAHIQGTKSENATVEIYNESALTFESRGRIQALFEGPIDVVITEDVLPCLSDAECISLSMALNELCEDVVHWVSPLSPGSVGSLNWKSLEDWKDFLPNDRFVRRGAGEVA